MIKGIYNENEFYANFYWDSKLLEDLRAKVCSDVTTEAAIAALKGLDTQFWSLKEMPEGDPKRVEALVSFYKSVFHALGYSGETREHQTSSGQQLSLLLDVRRAGTPELFAFLLDKAESGTFENSPVFLGAQLASEPEADDRELSEILQEELQDSQNPPRWIFVGAPNALFIIERNKWAFGRYLRIEWQEIFLQRDVKPYELLYWIAAKRVLCPDSGSSTHDELDENSHRHAYEVTTELRESVREAIELLINEMIYQRKEGHQKIYSAERADEYARELTHDALYYVYRLLFLLYLEAQGDDSELLPLKSEIYRNGYSLEKLLELDYIDIAPNSAESNGYFLFESLERIFNLIYFGFEPTKEGIFTADVALSGFLLKGIKSDLFDPSVIRHLKGTNLRNGVLLDILKRLSLTRKKERGGKPRARVSYANLGINQLGAVYEGLLSYTGFFAQEDLHALKPASVKQADIDSGKELDQVYLAPSSLVEKYRKASEKKYKIKDDNIVFDDSGNPKIYKKGSFIYRLAGRDRQKLASFYTPESLTKCTVRYALKVLFEKKKTLDDLWAIRVLEPAMGSGAFLNEAVNQLSERILELEVQQNIGDLRSPKAKQKRSWEIKYRLISENVYGVDLNPTAIELARFSLWLNCIGAGKEPPSFEGRLKVGNSLVGARFRKGADGIFPWLLLDEGMLRYGKNLKEYDAEGHERLSTLRKKLFASIKLSADPEILSLQDTAAKFFNLLLKGSEEERELAYQRLKQCGDLWASLFFIGPDELEDAPKSHSQLCGIFSTILEGGADWKEARELASRVSNRERFFHWEIEFPTVVSSGGFDLILGNPPWVAIEWQDSLYVSDSNPVPAVLELNAAETRAFVKDLDDPSVYRSLSFEYCRVEGYSNCFDTGFYRELEGVSKNTYKAFDLLSFSLCSKDGVFGVIQEDGVLEGKHGSKFRSQFYKRFRYHFQFQNEMQLFSEVLHGKKFSVNIFGAPKEAPRFQHVGNLFLPSTIDECFFNESQDDLAIKSENGQWEIRGNATRIIDVDGDTLGLFSRLSGEESDAPRFVNFHSQKTLNAFKSYAIHALPMADFFSEGQFVTSEMLHETSSQDKGIIAPRSLEEIEKSRIVLSGPNIFANNPLYAEPSVGDKSKNKYSRIDLGKIGADFQVRTVFQVNKTETVDSMFPILAGKPFRETYRIVTRKMIHPGNERMMFACIIPPGISYIGGINGVAVLPGLKILVAQGFLQSLFLDCFVRAKGSSNIVANDFHEFSVSRETKFFHSIARRVAKLNFLTNDYGALLQKVPEIQCPEDRTDVFEWAESDGKWTSKFPVRDELIRTKIECELEALIALSFSMNVDEVLNTIRTYMGVLTNRDKEKGFRREQYVKEAYKLFSERAW